MLQRCFSFDTKNNRLIQNDILKASIFCDYLINRIAIIRTLQNILIQERDPPQMETFQTIYKIASSVVTKLQEIKKICKDGIAHDLNRQYLESLNQIAKSLEHKTQSMVENLNKQAKQRNLSKKSQIIDNPNIQIQTGQEKASKKIQKTEKVQRKLEEKQKNYPKQRKSKILKNFPDKPRKPLGAYFMFLEKIRGQFQLKEHGRIFKKENIDAVREEWSQMSSFQKQEYKQEFDKKLKTYKKLIEIWYKKHPQQRPKQKNSKSNDGSNTQDEKTVSSDESVIGQQYNEEQQV